MTQKKTPDQKKRRVTITLDPIQHEIFRNRCQKDRRSVSTMIESLLIYVNQSKIASDKVISSI